MRIYAHVQKDTKFIKIFILANIGRLNFHKHHSTKSETVAKITINRWPSYGVMIMYNIVGICLFHKSVAHCDMLPSYKGWSTAQVLLKHTIGISQNHRLLCQ